MRKFFIILISAIFPVLLSAQNWKQNLPQGKPDYTLYDYIDAFNQYWAPFNVDKGYYYVNGQKVKAPGWKQFQRWVYENEGHVNPVTGEFPNVTAQQVYEEYLSQNDNPKAPLDANWTLVGPSSSGSGYAGLGRLNCIGFHPSNTNIYWVGAAAGGIWATTNNGSTWTCLNNNAGALAVSDIAIPSDFATTNTIYIATGDKDHWDNRSIGVLKSTNGGSTWSATGIAYNIADGKMVNRLLISPTDNQTILAATTNGVYKTTNGGTTWNTQLTSTNFIDMEFKPGDFNTLYGATTGGAIYMSSNGGASWTQVYSSASAKRIELGISPNQPTYVYAIAAGLDNGLYAILKSTNSGTSFTSVYSAAQGNLLGWSNDGSDSGGQGWYDLCLAVSPTNANTLLIGGVNTWRSTDGGSNWEIVSHWAGDGVQAVHADKHWIVFRSNGDIFECNDGGVYISTNTGTSWTVKTNGMNISQMYKLSTSKTVADETITGLQDNGTKLFSGGAWDDVKGGDGMECLIDYSNVNVQYGTYVNGQIDRTTDHWNSAYNIQPSGAGDGAWVTPYIIDPVNPQTLYAGYADVWKTTNRGSSWTKISTMNTGNKIRSMAVAASNNQVLYVADPTVIWKTTNGGTNWSNVTSNLPVSSASIQYIAIKNDDPNTVWVAMSGYTSPGVYITTNGGTTWTSISTGLPQIPAYCVIQNTQATGVQLLVGTELGVYMKDGTSNWVSFNTGLPNVRIGELEIYYNSNPELSRLRAATFGRGLWETPVNFSNTPMSFVSCTTTQNVVSPVSPGQTNQQIIGIQIVTTGNLSPLSATSFTLNTTGSTNPSGDLSGAQLFFTGTTGTYNSGTTYGSAVSNPNGTFTISGNQTLFPGINYFWVAYSLPVSATLGNVVDAQCTSLIAGTTRIPDITAPAGNRPIAITYCDAGSNSDYEHIVNVTMGDVNQSSFLGPNGYQDFTNQVIDMQIGTPLDITVTCDSVYQADELLIWVDWNQDGDFYDEGENMYTSGAVGWVTYSTSFAPPSDAVLGTTRMRIRFHDTENGPNNTPCGYSDWGEVEDYSIHVMAAPPVAGNAGPDQQVCYNTAATISLSGYTGNIQWQQSPDGVNDWIDVTSGTGANSDVYTSAPLTANIYFRAELTVSGYPEVYSNVVTVTVVLLPAAAGTIYGPDVICQGQNTVEYFVSPVAEATSYTWNLPPGATGSSTTNFIDVSFGLDALPGTISVFGTNSCGFGATSQLSVQVNEKPATPVISLVAFTLFSNASSGNQWYFNGNLINGATDQYYTPLENGTYYVVVTVNGCTSDESNHFVVNFVSIKEGDDKELLNVFPNPVSGKLNVEIKSDINYHQYRIISAEGKEVMHKKAGNKKFSINTADLAPGIYILQLIGDNTVYQIRFSKI